MVGGIADEVDIVCAGRLSSARMSMSPASSTGEAVPLPAQSRNRIGRHTGWLQNGNRTTIPTITHRLPRPSLAGPWADAVVGPERVVHLLAPAAEQGVVHHGLDGRVRGQQPVHDQPRDGEPEPIGVPGVLGEEPARASGTTPAQPPRRRRACPTTVRRVVRATRPVASSMNNPNVDERRNTGRSGCSSSSQEAGRVNKRSIGDGLESIADASHMLGPGFTPTRRQPHQKHRHQQSQPTSDERSPSPRKLRKSKSPSMIGNHQEASLRCRAGERRAPMELWQMDIVGEFAQADGTSAKALAGIDDHSRMCG